MMSLRFVAALVLFCVFLVVVQSEAGMVKRETSEADKNIQDLIDGATKKVYELVEKAKESADFSEFSKKATQLLEDAKNLYNKLGATEAKSP